MSTDRANQAALKKVALTGASGMVGTSLVRALEAKSMRPVKMIRHTLDASPDDIVWSPTSPDPVGDPSRLEDLDACIHLSGANVAAHRWTGPFKHEILESRVASTKTIAQLLAARKRRPRVLLCASATGIYGDRGDDVLTEKSAPGAGFLADTCRAWEAAAQPAVDAGIRVVHMRFGVVLAKEGGALKKVLPLFRAGLGGKLGSGQQWMSWISLRDLVRVVLYLLDELSISGPVNVVSPFPVTNAEYTRTLAHVLHRPAIVTAPVFALRLALGQMADEALLSSARVVPGCLAAAGFRFQDAQIDSALHAILSNKA